MKHWILFILFALTPFTLACGDHDGSMAQQGQGLVHASHISNDYHKQFPDPNINYNPNNPDHRGIFTWASTSLKGLSSYALTFDDGPHPTNTPRLLDILKKYDVKATFFIMGALADTYPAIVKRMVREGHTVASHDWRHDNSNNESRAVFKKGLSDSIQAIKKYSSDREVYYRFPYGAYARASNYHHFNIIKEVSAELFGENCINFAFWEIDTSDWVNEMTPKNIADTFWANHRGGSAWRFRLTANGYIKEPYTISKPRNGGVVLMHDIHKRTVDSVELILREASTQNIDFVLLKNVREFSFANKTCSLLP